MLEDAIVLRFLPADVDRAALLPVLQRIFARGALAADALAKKERHMAEQSGAGAGAQEGEQGRARSTLASRRRAQFSEVSRDLNQVFFEFPFAASAFPLALAPVCPPRD